MTEHDTLQLLARKYLFRLKKQAKKVGLEEDVDKLIKDNKNGLCIAEKDQVDLLSRAVEDDRIKYDDITHFVHYPFRKIYKENMIAKFIRKFKNRGQYSKVDAEILKNKLK